MAPAAALPYISAVMTGTPLPPPAARTRREILLARLRLVVEAAIGLALLGGAVYVLHREFSDVRLADVMAEFDRLSPTGLLLSVLLTVASYIALLVYERLGLAYVRAKVSFLRSSVTGFCAFVFSHNLGFALITGGSARLKLYMPAGLSVGQIVLVSGFTAWTFCLGAALVAGVSMFGEADRIARLVGGPPLAAHAVGAGLLIVLAGYLVLGMRDRFVEWRGRRLSTPGPILTPLQIIVPAIDVALAGLALYVLLPPLPIGPVGFVGLYVVATSIGLASHVPGGLGVFEGAMVLMLPELPLEPLIAAMLAYRLIYYLGPLALATLLFAATAVRDQRR